MSLVESIHRYRASNGQLRVSRATDSWREQNSKESLLLPARACQAVTMLVDTVNMLVVYYLILQVMSRPLSIVLISDVPGPKVRVCIWRWQ
jgi:hypothetical protein